MAKGPLLCPGKRTGELLGRRCKQILLVAVTNVHVPFKHTTKPIMALSGLLLPALPNGILDTPYAQVSWWRLGLLFVRLAARSGRAF